MLPPGDGDNINGPSLIRVPEWISNPLGKYYLYFAHHKGTYIRMAYADNLRGPWKIYTGGVLNLQNCLCNEFPLPDFSMTKHIASPDVHTDMHNQQIVMYFHCPVYTGGLPEDRKSYQQMTLRATSGDGLHFVAERNLLGIFYFRVFRWNGCFYAIARSGVLYKSDDGNTPFEKGPNPFLKIQNPSRLRHVAVTVDTNTLHVFYSRIGDKPESILYSKIALTEDWNAWTPTKPQLLLKPEYAYEGALLPLRASQNGIARSPVREVRDPAIFEEDGKTYLLYTVAGESGIALAEIG